MCISKWPNLWQVYELISIFLKEKSDFGYGYITVNMLNTIKMYTLNE